MRRRPFRDAPVGAALGAVTLGAVTAAFTITPAVADQPTYPSWGDVQQAKQSAAAAKAEVARITTLLTGLQAAADKAGRGAQIAAERAHTTQAAEQAAQQRHADLLREVDAATARARTSRMRAGLLASHLARTGAGDLPVDLLLNGSSATDLLHRLATMSQLSSASQAIYRTAVEDENTAKALGDQADVAAAELRRRADSAASALAAAQRSSAAAVDAVAEQQRHATQLLSQLAKLQNTTTRVAAAYVAGVQHRKDQERAAAAGNPASGSSGSSASGSGSSGGSSSGSSSGGSSSSSGAGSSSSGSGSSSSGSAGAPNSAQAASAVAFARDQIGDRYQFAGAGPDAWDCSGLTMQAYASVGIGIGGHSATAQYDVARAQGQLVSYSQAAVGDLIFYTDGGGDMYHVAIYSGSGMMIEAPYDGVPVREVPVRSYQRMPVVARPTA